MRAGHHLVYPASKRDAKGPVGQGVRDSRHYGTVFKCSGKVHNTGSHWIFRGIKQDFDPGFELSAGVSGHNQGDRQSDSLYCGSPGRFGRSIRIG
ncbi:hypothetical protein QQF73_00815 [Marinobacter sp. M216]|uniref:Uncharacterized protein n=1 Tax=Marinobacter albus TaxID=3030833 RepID=A0ABT7H9B2_9GAMM|nr:MULTISPECIES: hypothetical protein [unclassified Marinobacter]MBW7471575.1 hypothetical protein [Marinobacter sp. F4218]MDK9556146.1 hypothetical protein [Marinobacter sp. M216]